MMMTAATKMQHQQRIDRDQNRTRSDTSSDTTRDTQSREATPWHRPQTVLQTDDAYVQLKQRLARVPSLSRHSRQTLYVDLWTGQHWLGLYMSAHPKPRCASRESATTGQELLKPVSRDTAMSIASSPMGINKGINKGLDKGINKG